jgi:hypothetical protein
MTFSTESQTLTIFYVSYAMLLISNKVDGNKEAHAFHLFNFKNIFYIAFLDKTSNINIPLNMYLKIPQKKQKFSSLLTLLLLPNAI